MAANSKIIPGIYECEIRQLVWTEQNATIHVAQSSVPLSECKAVTQYIVINPIYPISPCKHYIRGDKNKSGLAFEAVTRVLKQL